MEIIEELSTTIDRSAWEKLNISPEYLGGIIDAALNHSISINTSSNGKTKVQSYIGFNQNNVHLKQIIETLFNPTRIINPGKDYLRIIDSESCFNILNVVQWLTFKQKKKIEVLLQIFATTLYFTSHPKIKFDGYIDRVEELCEELSRCIPVYPFRGPDFRYLAGYIEFKGYFRVTKRKIGDNGRYKYGIEIIFTDHDQAFLEWIQKSTQGSLAEVRDSYQLTLTSTTALEFLKTILPFVKEQKVLVETLIYAQEHINIYGKSKKVNYDLMEEFYLQSRKLNSHEEF